MDGNMNLNTLTSHPSYARSISSEIGRGSTENTEIKSKSRRRSSRKRFTSYEEFDDVGCSDLSDISDLSEYFSAEEDFSNLTIDTPTSGVFNSGDCEENNSSSESDDNPSLTDMSTRCEKVKAPSKKQKRRRRQLKSKILQDFNIPFQDVENFDLEVDDFKEDVESSAKNIQKQLPSLLELCLKTVWSKPSTTSRICYMLLPSRIKEIVNIWKRTRLFADVQYTWLNRILTDCENKDNFQTYYAIKEDDDYSDPDAGNWIFAHKTRNVWTMQAEVQDNEKHGPKLTSWLNFAINALSAGTLTCSNISRVYMVNLLAVLCIMIELVLQQLSKEKTKDAECQEIMDQELHVVRNILSKRYPTIINSMFDDAVPYVYWAHGNKHAAHHFLKLAQKARGDRRATLLSEAAKFYTQLGDPVLARKFYLQAADVIYTLSSPQDSHYIYIKVQMLMLMANIFDQGPMTCGKTKQSLDSWRAVLQVAPLTPVGTWLEAVESFLCYHCGVWAEGDKSQLEEGCKVLGSLVEKQPSLYLHLSLLQTLLGQESLSTYQLYTQEIQLLYSAVIPGLQFIDAMKKRQEHNPWQPILQSQGQPHLLKVMWRTQLQYMHTVVDNNVISEADVRGSHMNFHMSSRGHLTGDFQMLLPAIKAVELDVYTGQQIFVCGTTVANTWYKEDFNTRKCSNNFYYPTMTEIYNQDGNFIHILNVSSLPGVGVLDVQEGVNCLYWTGKNGETARLNLFRLVKQQWKEVTLRHIEIIVEDFPKANGMNVGSPGWAEEMKECLEYMYQQEAMFDQNILDKSRKDLRKQKKEKAKQQKTDKDKTHKTKANKKTRPTNLVKFPNRIVMYLTYGHTLFLAVKLTETAAGAIFIDCSSKETFLNPKFEFTRTLEIDSQAIVPTTVNQVIPRADVMWMNAEQKDGNKSQNGIFYYHQSGNLIYKNNYSHYVTPKPRILGAKIFGTSPQDNAVHIIFLDGPDKENRPSTFSVNYADAIELYVLADRLLLHLENKLLILSPDTLQPQSIQVTCCSPSLPVKDGDKEIEGSYTAIKILSDEKCQACDGMEYTKLVLSVDSHLLILHIDEHKKSNVNVVFCLEVAGHPTEYRYISQQTGFLLSTTQHYQIQDEYRENLYHFGDDGKLKGILPFLGPGPRDMFTTYLYGDEKTTREFERLGHPGWYLFLRDGHGGIMSVWLGNY